MGTIADLLNTAMRDFQRYTGDGLPNEPAGRPLPVGDPASGEHNPTKKQIRDAFRSLADVADGLIDPASEAAASADDAAEDAVQAALARIASEDARDTALAAAATLGATPYLDKATMDGVTPGTLPAYGYVYADADISKSGLYIYPSGGSAWAKDSLDLNDRLLAAKSSTEIVRLPQRLGCAGTPTTGSGLSTYTRIREDRVTYDGFLRTVSLFALSTETVYIKLGILAGDDFAQTAPDYPLAVVPGLNVFDLGTDFPVAAGDTVGWYAVTGVVSFSATTDSGSGYRQSPLSAFNFTKFTQATVTTSAQPQISFDFVSGELAKAARDAKTALSGVTQRIGVLNDPFAAGGLTAGAATFVDGQPFEADGVLSGFGIGLSAGGTAYVKIFEKIGNLLRQVGYDKPLSVVSGLNKFSEDDLGYIPVKKGQFAGVYAGAAVRYFNIPPDGPGYWDNTSAGNVTEFSDASLQTAIRLQVYWEVRSEGDVPAKIAKAELAALEEVPPLTETVTNATAQPTGLDVNLTVEYEYPLQHYADSDTLTLTAPTAGYTRYDLVYYDTVARAFGVVAGIERINDPGAFLPELADPDHRPLFNCQVKAGAVKPVPVWRLRGGVDYQVADQVEEMLRVARSRLPGTMGKIRRGSTLTIQGFADSIVAMQNDTPSDLTPNGVNRDRAAAALADPANYLRDNYGADVVDAIPLYTSVQLGRADDGAGAVHTKFGWIWELVRSLELSGYTLGTDLFYDNFGRGGKSSADAVSGTTPTAWLNAATAFAPDLAIIALGMNELGNTATLDRLIICAQEFQVAGSEVLFVDCPRRIGSANTQNWRLTNRIIKRAADFTGAAHLSLASIYEDGRTHAIGVTEDNINEANKINHPGIPEHVAIGALNSRLFLG